MFVTSQLKEMPVIIDGDRVEVAHAISCELGEGALWHEQLGAYLHVDIYGPSLLCAGPAVYIHDAYHGAAVRVLPLPSFVGTVVPSSARGGAAELLVALRDGFARLDIASGAVTPLANPDGVPTNRWNDGKCSPEGRLWAGTMGAPGLVTAGAGGLFVLERDEATARRAVSGVTISNGLAWSADGKTMYYIDTALERVDAFDYDAAAGTLANRRVAFTIPEGTGHPDGCCTDAAGNLWVAQWGGSRVVAYRPEDGTVVAEVRVPAAHVSSVAFGGPGLADLYITTAKEHLSAEERAAQPLAGHCFIVRSCGFVGVPAGVFKSERG